MMKESVCLLFLIFFIAITGLAMREMVIIFKDGREIVFDSSEIEKVYYRGSDENSDITGKWYGDKGIRNIYINKQGIYSIQLENGYTWSDYVLYEGDLMIFKTPYPIPIEYFLNYNIPEDIAEKGQKIIKKPDEWLFLLSEKGNVLSGQKNCFIITFSGDKLFDIDFVERNSEWCR